MQRRQAELDEAKKLFSGTRDLLFAIDSLARQILLPDGDYYASYRALDAALRVDDRDSQRLYVAVPVRTPHAQSTEGPVTLKVRLQPCAPCGGNQLSKCCMPICVLLL